MKTEINDGGRAFPAVRMADYPKEQFGMSLRDWFAGMALNKLVDGFSCESDYLVVAEHAYKYANAMIAERSKR